MAKNSSGQEAEVPSMRSDRELVEFLISPIGVDGT